MWIVLEKLISFSVKPWDDRRGSKCTASRLASIPSICGLIAAVDSRDELPKALQFVSGPSHHTFSYYTRSGSNTQGSCICFHQIRCQNLNSKWSELSPKSCNKYFSTQWATRSETRLREWQDFGSASEKVPRLSNLTRSSAMSSFSSIIAEKRATVCLSRY